MTETLEAPATTGGDDPSATATAWLDGFEAALAARDVPAAAAMFATECFWRDLVSFTWNLTTVEGRDGVADLLGETLERTDPSGFALDEPADEADGVVTAWFTFETAVGRGRGLLRLVQEDGARQGLDLPHHAVRAQGARGAARRPHRPMGAEHGADQGPHDLAGAAAGRRPRASGSDHPAVRPGHRRRAGRHRARRPAAPARRAEPGHRQARRAPATSGATATSRCACTTRSGTTTCPT